MYDSGLDAYQHAATEARAASASPQELVLMLIDGLLDEIARADGHMKARNFERKGRSISKCMQILGGLDTALDMENGGETALNLHRLYDYCGRQLFEASLRNEVEGLRAVERILSNLREGWQALGQNIGEPARARG